MIHHPLLVEVLAHERQADLLRAAETRCRLRRHRDACAVTLNLPAREPLTSPSARRPSPDARYGHPSIAEFEHHRHILVTASGHAGYLDTGGRAPAVLLVHGVGNSGVLWRHLLRAFDDERRCVAVDLPLHGRTAGVAPQDFSLPSLARYVGDLCRRAGASRSRSGCRRALPQARLVMIPDAGHVAYLEQPESYLALVHAFLTDRPLPLPTVDGTTVPADYRGTP